MELIGLPHTFEAENFGLPHTRHFGLPHTEVTFQGPPMLALRTRNARARVSNYLKALNCRVGCQLTARLGGSVGDRIRFPPPFSHWRRLQVRPNQSECNSMQFSATLRNSPHRNAIPEFAFGSPIVPTLTRIKLTALTCGSIPVEIETRLHCVANNCVSAAGKMCVVISHGEPCAIPPPNLLAPPALDDLALRGLPPLPRRTQRNGP